MTYTVNRVEVGIRPDLKDSLGEKTARRIQNDLGISGVCVKTIKVYLIHAAIDETGLFQYVKSALSDPVLHRVSVNDFLAILWLKEGLHDWNWLIEVGFRPGVTDNEGRVAAHALSLSLKRPMKEDEAVYTAIQYCLKGHLTREQVEGIAQNLLANDLIQRVIVRSSDELLQNWQAHRPSFYAIPQVTSQQPPRVETIRLAGLSDEELIRLSKERLLALSLEEMKAICAYYQRPEVQMERQKVGLGPNPTDVELEALAQTWSEHCKHKIFNALIEYEEEGQKELIDSLFNTHIKGGTEVIRKTKGDKDFCLSVFKDNSGVISFNDRWNIAFKVETHNSPSALDPYGGALTGIVGVNRDPFGTGMGARLIFNTDVFCFGPPDYKKPLPKGLLHPKRIFEGVREGVEHGGNQSGIPTVNGSIVFDERYVGKPLVFCGTGGILPKEVCARPSFEKKAQPGDYIVMCGGRIGKDGIHGATFSSEELHEGSPATAVQIGDAITQKKMTDFLLRARDLCLYNSITDNGAGGLSSSVGEMAEDTGGFQLHLDKAPLKYHGLQPWEILLSEAQERMTVAVPPEKLDEFLALSQKMDVESTVLGQFDNNGRFHCLYEGRTVAYLDMDFMHKGSPRMHLKAVWQPPFHEEPDFSEPSDLKAELKAILGSYNVASKEYVVRQYDHEVQAGSAIKPLMGNQCDGPSDAAVLRIDLHAFDGLVVAHGICPKYSDIDTYWMAACAVDEAVRNALCVGGTIEHMAGLDNFCWCDPVQSEKTPDGHYKLAQLVRANKALYEICTTYGVPCISGKDSMKNDAIIGGVKISIPPTLLFSVISRVPDIRRCVSMDAKKAGDLVYVLGMTYAELGGSEYYRLKGFVGNTVPRVRAKEHLQTFQAIQTAIQEGLVASCHDCSDGGLAVALAETAFAGGLGMEIELSSVPQKGITRLDTLLFSESQGRFVLTIPAHLRSAFERLIHGLPAACVGQVTANQDLICRMNGQVLLNASVGELKAAWQAPLAW